MAEEKESASSQTTPPECEPRLTITPVGDGSYDLSVRMKCYPDGAGGWICN